MAYDLKNEEEVREYLKNLHIEYQFACYSEKDPTACHLLGEYTAKIKQDHEKAMSIFKTNCDVRNHAQSCSRFGSSIAARKKSPENVEEGCKYLWKACDLNDKTGCIQASMLSIVKFAKEKKIEEKKNVERCVGILEKACNDDNIETACHFLSNAYLSGFCELVPKDFSKAFKYAMISCNNGNPIACSNVSLMYNKGDGVKEDKSQALHYNKLAKELHKEIKKAQSLAFQLGNES